jgi:hypothetical protein
MPTTMATAYTPGIIGHIEWVAKATASSKTDMVTPAIAPPTINCAFDIAETIGSLAT